MNYLESLEFKLKSAEYHHKQTISVLRNHQNLFKDEDDQLVAVSSEFTAMMLTFQSSLDVLAQWINAHVLNSQFPVRKVDFETLFKENVTLDDKLELNLLSLKENHLTIYLRAFCNTVKHRNMISVVEQPELIPSEYLFPSENLILGRQFVINEFKFNSKSFVERNIVSQLDATFGYLTKTLREIIDYIKLKY